MGYKEDNNYCLSAKNTYEYLRFDQLLSFMNLGYKTSLSTTINFNQLDDLPTSGEEDNDLMQDSYLPSQAIEEEIEITVH